MLRSYFESWNGPQRLATWLTPELSEDRLRKRRDRFAEKWPLASINAFQAFAASADDVWSRIAWNDLPVLAGIDRERLKLSLTAEVTRIFWLTAIGRAAALRK